MNKTSSVNNKKIFKNTVALYARMLLSMIVSLYTSRIVLNALGVDDYGIYGLVGGIVVLFSFLNVTMSGATSRFLTVELAKNDPRQLQQTFNTAFILHIGIAIIVLFLAETVGLWLLFEKLNIPDECSCLGVSIFNNFLNGQHHSSSIQCDSYFARKNGRVCYCGNCWITVEVADRYTSTYYSM